MKWIVEYSKDIAVDYSQLQARSIYIKRVTNAAVSTWSFIKVNEKVSTRFICCTSNDEVNGTFITTHINNVPALCSLREVCDSKFIVANTCIWNRMAHKELLYKMMPFNREIELWFAKQELSMDNSLLFRQSATINNVGQFGFQTSLSERKLFANRNKGIVDAIKESFVRVSPVILLGD